MTIDSCYTTIHTKRPLLVLNMLIVGRSDPVHGDLHLAATYVRQNVCGGGAL